MNIALNLHIEYEKKSNCTVCSTGLAVYLCISTSHSINQLIVLHLLMQYYSILYGTERSSGSLKLTITSELHH